MPNWVYTTIRTDKSNEKFVKNVMDRGGICEYYMPMPDDIRFTNSPNHIISKEDYAIKEALGQATETKARMTIYYQTQEMVDELKVKYNAENWYEWAYKYWGTKWGDCEMEYRIDGDELIVHYKSAWSPIGDDFIDSFMSELKNGEYIWEEEQGYGGQAIFEDGEVVDSMTWDTPDFTKEVWMDSDEHSGTQEMYVYLEEPYRNNVRSYEPGWHLYSDWYVGDSLVTDPELIEKLESAPEDEN